uniref:Uncharacterized protein n=1 Tax=Anguilla anguilla TaxID=7936 RepID=A0A0E9W816_ANGAN
MLHIRNTLLDTSSIFLLQAPQNFCKLEFSNLKIKKAKGWKCGSWHSKRHKKYSHGHFNEGVEKLDFCFLFSNADTHMKNSGDEGLLSLLEPVSLKPFPTSFSYFSL